MKFRNTLVTLAILLTSFASACAQTTKPTRPKIAVYYFANYHPNDERNLKTKGEGWSEWELVKNAKPRFPGTNSQKCRCGAMPMNPTRR